MDISNERDKIRIRIKKYSFIASLKDMPSTVRIPVDCDRHSDLIATAIPA